MGKPNDSACMPISKQKHCVGFVCTHMHGCKYIRKSAYITQQCNAHNHSHAWTFTLYYCLRFSLKSSLYCILTLIHSITIELFLIVRLRTRWCTHLLFNQIKTIHMENVKLLTTGERGRGRENKINSSYAMCLVISFSFSTFNVNKW